MTPERTNPSQRTETEQREHGIIELYQAMSAEADKMIKQLRLNPEEVWRILGNSRNLSIHCMFNDGVSKLTVSLTHEGDVSQITSLSQIHEMRFWDMTLKTPRTIDYVVGKMGSIEVGTYIGVAGFYGQPGLGAHMPIYNLNNQISVSGRNITYNDFIANYVGKTMKKCLRKCKQNEAQITFS